MKVLGGDTARLVDDTIVIGRLEVCKILKDIVKQSDIDKVQKRIFSSKSTQVVDGAILTNALEVLSIIEEVCSAE